MMTALNRSITCGHSPADAVEYTQLNRHSREIETLLVTLSMVSVSDFSESPIRV